MNTTENNKLLAEFLGFELSHKIERVPNNEIFKEHINLITDNTDNLPFHNDWNWLMEVVEKIESLENVFAFCIIFDKYTKQNRVEIHPEDDSFTKVSIYKKSKNEAVYNACIEFVRWWNEQ